MNEQVEKLAKELYGKCSYVTKWESVPHLHKYWINVATHVLGLIIQARIHECKQFMTLNPINASYRRLTENKIEELDNQLQTLNPPKEG